MVRVREVATDDAGAFELGPIRPGRRELEIRTRDRGPLLRDPIDLAPGRWRAVTNRIGLGPAEIEVLSDQTAHLELRLR